MEGKNLILAISLSAFVLIMWAIFFAPPPPTIDKETNKIEKTQKESEFSSPSIDAKKEIKEALESINERLNYNLNINF